MRSSRILDLASKISITAQAIDHQLEASQQPPLSFELDAVPELPAPLQAAQTELLEAVDEIQMLVQGPLLSILFLTGLSHNARSSIREVVRLRIAQTFPIGHTTTYTDIARTVNMDEIELATLLRHAMTYRIFTEPVAGLVAHTPTSRLLAERQDLVRLIEQNVPEVSLGAARHDSAGGHSNSQHSSPAAMSTTASDMGSMTDGSGTVDQRRMGSYATTIELFTQTPSFSLDSIVQLDDWRSIRTLIDIGGNRGQASFAIARRYPHLRCIVQDVSKIVETTSTPPDLEGRVSFMVHDYFKEQKVLADAYLLRWVLHEWSDYHAVKILRSLIYGMQIGAKIVINDICLPKIEETTMYQQRFARATDLTMKQRHNARERDQEDWRRLFEMTHPGLQLLRISHPPGAALAIIIAIWNGRTIWDVNSS